MDTVKFFDLELNEPNKKTEYEINIKNSVFNTTKYKTDIMKLDKILETIKKLQDIFSMINI
jgi:hypothetical protein